MASVEPTKASLLPFLVLVFLALLGLSPTYAADIADTPVHVGDVFTYDQSEELHVYRVLNPVSMQGGVGQIYSVEETVSRAPFILKVMFGGNLHSDWLRQTQKGYETMYNLQHAIPRSERDDWPFIRIWEKGQVTLKHAQTGASHLFGVSVLMEEALEFNLGGLIQELHLSRTDNLAKKERKVHAIYNIAASLFRALSVLQNASTLAPGMSGLVHGDIKPLNVFFRSRAAYPLNKSFLDRVIDGRVLAVLADFDTVYEKGSLSDFMQEAARGGMAYGTPDYQPENAGSHLLTAYDDVYAVAICVMEMFLGIVPNLVRLPAEEISELWHGRTQHLDDNPKFAVLSRFVMTVLTSGREGVFARLATIPGFEQTTARRLHVAFGPVDRKNRPITDIRPSCYDLRQMLTRLRRSGH